MRLIALIAIAATLAACSPPASPPESSGPASTSQTQAAAPTAVADLAQVSAPTANSAVTSPLHVTGVAPANWYFENQFPVRLVDAQGQTIAEAPATPRVNWTANAEPKEFDAMLSFTVSGPATLVLQEDNARGDATPREVRVPLTLAR